MCWVNSINLSSYWQLLENASSVADWLSTNVCSVWAIANCSRGESSSIAMCATHRWDTGSPSTGQNIPELKIQFVQLDLSQLE